MEKYCKKISGDYIIGIGTNCGNVEITKEEYENILSVICNRPTAESGWEYRLRTNLTWELVEAPVVTEEAEATEADYIAALAELGVTVDEEV